MMSCEAVCRNQAGAGAKREPNIHKASFIERRLFYLNHLNVVARRVPSPMRQSPHYKMKLIRILLLLVFLAVLVPAPVAVRAQTPGLSPEVKAILDSMTPEERAALKQKMKEKWCHWEENPSPKDSGGSNV